MNINFLKVWYDVTSMLLLSSGIYWMHYNFFNQNWWFTMTSLVVTVTIQVLIEIHVLKLYK